MINRQTALFGLNTPEDKTLVSSMCDKAEKSIFSGVTMFTKFLSPREVKMATDRLSQFVKVDIFGGYSGAERCVAAFSDLEYGEDIPVYMYPIQAIVIKTKNKTVYSHRDYLGSLMNLGISRDLMGDIVICEDSVVVFCLEEIADYIMYNLTKVSNTGVILEKCEADKIVLPEKQYKIFLKTVASLRLDCIVSACINKSRSTSAEYIERGLVTCDYEVVKNVSYQVSDKSTLSVRGYGKFLIEAGDGLSKKGKIKLSIKQYI